MNSVMSFSTCQLPNYSQLNVGLPMCTTAALGVLGPPHSI